MYTHGYGVAMNPVNAVGARGAAAVLHQGRTADRRDPHPAARGVLWRARPSRPLRGGAYGHGGVRLSARRRNAQTIYQGRSGVELNPPWRRLAYAWQFHDVQPAAEHRPAPDSQLLYRRNVRERVATIAPFLRLDADPYIVVMEDGWSGCSTPTPSTNRYPYAQPYPRPSPGRRFNYIRNSVKVAVDAYDGTTTFYVADPDRPADPDLRGHLPGPVRRRSRHADRPARAPALPGGPVPVQTEMYLTYHMQNPTVFYNREDLWSVPFERFGEERQPAFEPAALMASSTTGANGRRG